MGEPLLTVVVCTHDRPDDLQRCLRGLAALDQEVGVIVVDSASSPPLREVVDGFFGSFRRLTYHYEQLAGLARARNRGIELAQSDLVAFIDDDTVPEPTWATRLVAPFADPNVVCVGGTCRASFDSPPPRWLSSRLLQFAGITRFGEEPRAARSSAEYPFGANICFRRARLLEIGGFPEELGRVGGKLLSGEEYEVIETLVHAGWSIWLEPSAVVDHRVSSVRCRSRYYWRRLWWQGVSRARARRSALLAVRLIAAAIVRLALWTVTGDRFYLFRTAETAGYVLDCLRPRAAST
jgi:cellulose synthase/poly-beta-1,6-N-acetylglucosamine synthase-like glycosyltransferase